MKSVFRLPLAVLLAASASACVSTTFTHTWKAPDAQALDPQGYKIAAVYITSDEGGRRVAEDVLVQKLSARGAQGVASYSLVSREKLEDMAYVQARLLEAGVDGVLTLRVIDEKQEISLAETGYRPWIGPHYGRLTRYWDYGWDYPYEPARINNVVRVETLVYSLTRDELLWAGTSRTVNPKELPKFVAGLADELAKRLMHQGLLTHAAEPEAATPAGSMQGLVRINNIQLQR